MFLQGWLDAMLRQLSFNLCSVQYRGSELLARNVREDARIAKVLIPQDPCLNGNIFIARRYLNRFLCYVSMQQTKLMLVMQ